MHLHPWSWPAEVSKGTSTHSWSSTYTLITEVCYMSWRSEIKKKKEKEKEEPKGTLPWFIKGKYLFYDFVSLIFYWWRENNSLILNLMASCVEIYRCCGSGDVSSGHWPATTSDYWAESLALSLKLDLAWMISEIRSCLNSLLVHTKWLFQMN